MSLLPCADFQEIVNQFQEQSLLEKNPTKTQETKSPKKQSPKRSPEVLSGQFLKSRIEDRQLISQLYRKIAILEKVCTQKENLNRQLSYELSQVRISLMGVEYNNQKQRKELHQRINSTLKDIDKTNQEVKVRQEQERNQLEIIKNQREALRLENINLLKKIQSFQNKQADQSDQIIKFESMLLQKVLQLSSDISKFSEPKNIQSKEREKKERKNPNIEKNLSEIQKKLVRQRLQHQEAVENLKRQYQKIVQFRLMKKYQSKINLLAELKNKILQFQQKNANLQEQIKKGNHEIRQYGYQIHKFDNQRLILESKVRAVQAENSSLLDKNQKSIEKYKILCKEVEKLKEFFQTHVNQLELNNTQLKNQVALQKRKVDKLKETLKKFEQNIKLLTQKLQNSYQSYHNIQTELNLVRQRLHQQVVKREKFENGLKQIKLSQSDSKEIIMDIKSIRKKTRTEVFIRRQNQRNLEQIDERQ